MFKEERMVHEAKEQARWARLNQAAGEFLQNVRRDIDQGDLAEVEAVIRQVGMRPEEWGSKSHPLGDSDHGLWKGAAPVEGGAEPEVLAQAQAANKASVVIDYGAVSVSRLVVTNDRREYEAWQKRGKVEVLFEPRVMTESGGAPVYLFIVGIQLGRPSAHS